jgi:catechol 2,3-dioxygenase-like lactoylglutathione lyase family enzyme
VKKWEGDSWVPAPQYGRSLQGFGANLLVRDVAIAVAFAVEVLDAMVVYADPDFAVLRSQGSEWMLHADHTYDKHPLHGSLTDDSHRGVGVEFRLHGLDPDAAEARARARGDTVLAGSIDKPHGLRECYLVDPDGYLWVPDVPTTD